MGLLRRWQAERDLRRRATACARALAREPAEEDVHWLAAHGTAGDLDHARWELRYARRALGLIAAQRDALDDRTASAVAHALAAELARGLAGIPGLTLDPASGSTNIVVFEVADAPALVAALADHGVKMGALGPTTVRAVTHLDVDDEDIERAVELIPRALGALAHA
jgi:hypothetical protein